MTHSKRLIKGTVITLVFMFLSSVIGYVLKVIFARNFSVVDIGLYFSVFGFIAFFIFLRDLGLADSLTYFLPRFLIEKAKKKIKASILFTFYIQLLIAGIFFIFLLLFAKPLSIIYFKDSRAVMLLICFGIYFILDSVTEILLRAFQGHQKFFLLNSVQFFFQFSSFIIFLIFVFIKIPISLFGIPYLFSSLLTGIIFSIVFIKKLFPDFFKIKTKISKPFMKKILNYSIPAMTGTFAIVMFSYQTTFFLTLFTKLENVGYYVMLSSLVKISIFFFIAMTQVFTPMISELWKKRQLGKLNMIFNELITSAYVVALPVSLMLIMFSKEVLRILYSEQYIAVANIMQILAISILFYGIVGSIRIVFLNIGQPKLARTLVYITLGVNIGLNLLLIPLYGLIGAALADIGATFISMLYAIHMLKKFPVKIRLMNFAKLGVASLIHLMSIVILKRIFVLDVIPELVIVGIISGTIYLLLLFVFKILDLKKILRLFRTTTNIRIPFIDKEI